MLKLILVFTLALTFQVNGQQQVVYYNGQPYMTGQQGYVMGQTGQPMYVMGQTGQPTYMMGQAPQTTSTNLFASNYNAALNQQYRQPGLTQTRPVTVVRVPAQQPQPIMVAAPPQQSTTTNQQSSQRTRPAYNKNNNPQEAIPTAKKTKDAVAAGRAGVTHEMNLARQESSNTGNRVNEHVANCREAGKRLLDKQSDHNRYWGYREMNHEAKQTQDAVRRDSHKGGEYPKRNLDEAEKSHQNGMTKMENVLRNRGVSDEEIETWKQKCNEDAGDEFVEGKEKIEVHEQNARNHYAKIKPAAEANIDNILDVMMTNVANCMANVQRNINLYNKGEMSEGQARIIRRMKSDMHKELENVKHEGSEDNSKSFTKARNVMLLQMGEMNTYNTGNGMPEDEAEEVQKCKGEMMTSMRTAEERVKEAKLESEKAGIKWEKKEY